VADGDPGELLLNVIREHGAGGIARIAEEQGLRPGCDRRLDRRRVKGEVILQAGRDELHDAAGERHGRRVRNVRGLVKHDLVAGIASRSQREVHRLGRADRDEQLAGRVVRDAVASLEVSGEGAP
jgi:hypothetical protein